ncbi:hypothetical protein FRC08_011514 [Ceratobasidium sp. 394]|nr:hypothetical protein FRC08_011514 [Ceratobasidium sp. 394]
MSQPPPPEIHHSPPLPRRVPPVGQPRVHRYVAIVSYTCVGGKSGVGRAKNQSSAQIAVISVYNIFFADYGEKEHVFSPARRWLDRQKAAFWTLSPAEQAAAERVRQQQPTLPHDVTRPT